MMEDATRKRVLFVISEDWFFASHFLSLAQAIQQAGYAVSVHLRVNDPALQRRIERSGIRVVPSDYRRRQGGPIAAARQVRRFVQVFRREKPDIVHAISLRVVVLGGIAAVLAGVPARVHALTGLGLLGASRSPRTQLVLGVLKGLFRFILGGPRAAYLFENRDDPQRFGLVVDDRQVVVVGGAGIDPATETALPLPSGPTLRIAIVSRMIFSKGIDVAVQAVGRARESGADVTLTLVGLPDHGNPRSLTESDLTRMAAQPGVTWAGRSDDIRAVWRDHHVVCVPSLGGEGLPRALLEGAAASRAIVTTTTPGCATFVRDGVEGLLVAPGDVEDLARAFVTLASDRDTVAAMGSAARRRVLDGFTTEAVAVAVVRLYQHVSP